VVAPRAGRRPATTWIDESRLHELPSPDAPALAGLLRIRVFGSLAGARGGSGFHFVVNDANYDKIGALGKV